MQHTVVISPHLPISPHISPCLPISPHISPYLPISPYQVGADLMQDTVVSVEAAYLAGLASFAEQGFVLGDPYPSNPNPNPNPNP